MCPTLRKILAMPTYDISIIIYLLNTYALLFVAMKILPTFFYFRIITTIYNFYLNDKKVIHNNSENYREKFQNQ